MTPTEIRSALEAHAAACRKALSAIQRAAGDDVAVRITYGLLSGADLSGANLTTGIRIASLCFGGWSVTVTPGETTIGCQTHPNEKWLAWQPADVREMHPDAKAWWSRHREAVCAVIRNVMQPLADEAGRRA